MNEPLNNPLALLVMAMGGGLDSATDAINTQGKAIASRELSRLPVDRTPQVTAALEKEGFVFGEVEPGGLFQSVTFPKGWSLDTNTGHEMWSYLRDPQGRQRGSMFYKAAFYDRSAHLRLDTRFSISQTYEDRNTNKLERFQVLDSGRVLFELEIPGKFPISQTGIVDREAWFKYENSQKETLAAATKWLEERYPDWKNVEAYWELP